MALTNEPENRTRTRRLGALAREEDGQVLPLLLVVIIGLLAAGMVVFWLGFSTSIATDAQTAADAAALAAEQSVDTQWNTLINVNGVLEPRGSYDPGLVQAAAHQWASKPNQGTLVSVEYCTESGGCSPQPIFTSEPDVLVTVHSSQTLPAGSVSPGALATAQARASVDPFAQASPPVAQPQASSTCDPVGVPGPSQFKAHGGQAGFFEESDTKFAPGDPCEYGLASRLDALGKSLKLHLVGVWGAGADNPAGPGKTADAVTKAHACGSLAQVQGLPTSVTQTQLARFGLARFPGQPDQIEFASPTARCATRTLASAQGTSGLQASLGNGKVHLVALTGGPQGAATLGIGALPGIGPWPAIASYIRIYQRLAAQYGWDQAQLQDWLKVEYLEDASGDLGMQPSGAFGLAQFQTVNYCRYGPGSCPQDNPTAEQELESMAAYIKSRYGDPAAALAWEYSHHWY
jgi:hypothetical protein